MTNRLHADEFPSEPDKGQGVPPTSPAKPKLPADSDATVDTPAEPATPNQLTAEEQMALFEKELKENDWGHQPC